MKKALNVAATVWTTGLMSISIVGIAYAIVQMILGNVTGNAHFEF